MGTITAKSIVDNAAADLLDAANVRWTKSMLLRYLNDGQRQIVSLRPDAGGKVASIVLAAGAKQALPTDGIRLFEIRRNMGADGATPGPAVRIIDREELDALNPDWMSAANANDIVHYTYDGRVPKTFYVYPGGTLNRMVEALYQAVPTDATINGVDGSSSDSAISLDDIYQPSLAEYIRHRAYEEQTDARDNAKAASHWTKFLQTLGLKVSVDKAVDPNRNAPPQDTARKAGGERAPAF